MGAQFRQELRPTPDKVEHGRDPGNDHQHCDHGQHAPCSPWLHTGNDQPGGEGEHPAAEVPRDMNPRIGVTAQELRHRQDELCRSHHGSDVTQCLDPSLSSLESTRSLENRLPQVRHRRGFSNPHRSMQPLQRVLVRPTIGTPRKVLRHEVNVVGIELTVELGREQHSHFGAGHDSIVARTHPVVPHRSPDVSKSTPRSEVPLPGRAGSRERIWPPKRLPPKDTLQSLVENIDHRRFPPTTDGATYP